jgi:MFS family permease
MTPTLTTGLAIRVFACFASAYFLSYALRSVNAMIAPGLIAEFGLSHSQLGALSSAYFFAFAALQLPLGVWLDRFGSRRVDAALLLIAAVGCVTFALATNATMLWIGRALIGAGVAGGLMCALSVYRFWYRPERQQQLGAWMLMVGSTGALVTTVPVQAVLPVLGWRGLFWLAALLILASSAAIYFLLSDPPGQKLAAPGSAGAQWAGYREVFASGRFWRFACASGLIQASFIAFQGLWVGPWFNEVLGMPLDQVARALFMFNLVLMGAYLALGWAAPRLAARGWSTLRLVGVAGVLVLLFELAIAFADGPRAWLLWVAVAVVVPVHQLAHTHVSLSFPAHLTGRAFSAYNLVVFASMFLIQWLFGVAVDLFGGAADGGRGFRAAMIVWVAVQAVGLAVLLLWPAKPGVSEARGSRERPRP